MVINKILCIIKMIFIILILILIVITWGIVIYKEKNKEKNKEKTSVENVNIDKKLYTHMYFIYPEGYDISLQSMLGYEDEYIHIVETDQDDVYEMHINNDYIGYINGTVYITTESEKFDNFLRLKVKIFEIDDKKKYIHSVDDNMVIVYTKFNDSFYLKNFNELQSNKEYYDSKNLIFERDKRS